MRRLIGALFVVALIFTVVPGCTQKTATDGQVITQSDPIWEGATCSTADAFMQAADVTIGSTLVQNPQIKLYYMIGRPVAQIFYNKYCLTAPK